jgi:hypothetical protein
MALQSPHNDHHNSPCRNGLARRLALAMANDCGGAATDYDRRSRTIQRKCAEDPERRLVSAGDWACRLYDYDHLAHRTSIGDGAFDEPDGAARALSRYLRKGTGSPRIRDGDFSHHAVRERPGDPAAQPEAQQGTHQTVLLVRVLTDNFPQVSGPNRIKARKLGSGFWQIEVHFGFAQTPNLPRELARAEIPGLELDASQISVFVGRTNVKPGLRPGMARWRERLYSSLARIATRQTEFFHIPSDRVIELGTPVEI